MFNKGRELFFKKEYGDAVRYFTRGTVEQLCDLCRVWLGNCYEHGLGVPKDLSMAKDLYEVTFRWLGGTEKNGKLGNWIRDKLQNFASVPKCDEYHTFLEGVGNVKVKRWINAPNTPSIRFNKNEIVVTINYGTAFIEGIHHVSKSLINWTCDGVNRFYDGYKLETDNFNLKVIRGGDGKYHSVLKDRECILYFPNDINLEHIHSQEAILRKVQELLFELAKNILPRRLSEISNKLGLSEKKCKIVKKNRKAYATNYTKENLIEFSAVCVQLPTESLEALIIHELAHDFVLEHNMAFYQKMEEWGGERVCFLEKHLFEENKWSYIRF